MDVLILGGTVFLGRAIARQALARGHRVTCAARGTGEPEPGCEFVRVDRDEDAGLAAVRGREWDAVVEVSRTARHVQRATRDLAARHWVFVSSGNVYARFDRPGQAESAALLPGLEDLDDSSDYGRAKVTCEGFVRGVAATSTIVRSGLISGPGDPHSRVGYYPWRFAHPTGPDVLVPGDPDFPTAVIDVDDLAAWIVLAAEERIDGVFNASGPVMSLAEVIGLAAEITGSAAVPRWVPAAELGAAGVAAWMGPRSLPLWIDDPEWRYFATMDTSAARAAGLVTRPMREVLVRAWRNEEARDSGAERTAGLTDAEEQEVRALLAGEGQV